MAKQKSKSGKKKQRPFSEVFVELFQVVFILVLIALIGRFVYQGFVELREEKTIVSHTADDSNPKFQPKTEAVKSKSAPSQPQTKHYPPPQPKQKRVEYYPVAAPARPRLQPVQRQESFRPRIAFVIDDMGNTDEFQNELFRLGRQVTYAVLPNLPYSKLFADLSRKTGADVILHLPLEAESGIYPGPGVIEADMPEERIVRLINQNLESVPYTIGVNNHMGSQVTQDERAMRIILKDLKLRGKFFLDSYTTVESVAVEMADQVRLPVLRRDVFLDNVDEPEAIRKQVALLANLAQENGSAIGIGHYRYNTLTVIAEEIERLKRQGFDIVTLPKLLEEKYY